MKQILILWLSIIAICADPFQRYTNYQEYLAEWRKIVPEKYIHHITDIPAKQQICAGKKCEFYYYEYQNQSITQQIYKRTVLLVSGMHGDQYLGPHTLLNAYQHLNAYKIIYFPMANPSGFARGQRQTYPLKLDPNRDYPIDGNLKCYQTSATHILDKIFRQYSIDLTIVIHNGLDEIGFNWGTETHKANSHTVEYQRNLAITQMMKRIGGGSKSLQLKEFKIGTMTEIIYPARGTFDDWAYAASRYPSIITKCNQFQYEPYPQNMTNGLLFLIEMGPKNAIQLGSEQGINLSPTSDSRHNGYIARGIRILKQTLNVVRPSLVLRWKGSTCQITVKGCKQATIANLSVYTRGNDSLWQNVLVVDNETIINGDLAELEPTAEAFVSGKPIYEGDWVKYEGFFACDVQWEGNGTTFFANARKYPINFQGKVVNEHSYTANDIPTNFNYYKVGYAVIGLIALILLVYRVRNNYTKKKIQKFEQIQHVESANTIDQDGEEEMGGDLHTARGGIIQM